MIATLKSFNKSTKYEGKTIITVTTSIIDEVTGLPKEDKLHYIVVPTVYYKDLVGQLVELELVKSPKLGFDVVNSIKLAQQ